MMKLHKKKNIIITKNKNYNYNKHFEVHNFLNNEYYYL